MSSLFDDLDAGEARRYVRSNREKMKKQPKWIKPMDDIQIFKPDTVPRNEVVLGTYGSLEWIGADLKRRRFIEGKQTLEIENVWLTPAGFHLSGWVVEKQFPSFTFFEHNQVVIPTQDGHMHIVMTKGKITVTLTGSIEFCHKWNDYFQQNFKNAENLIRWVYNTRGDDISVPLNYRKGANAAYPWLGRPYEQYIRDYLDSDACVLILIGPPGTGKTTFIKNVIHQTGGGARVAYDEKVLSGDDFFASFVDSEDDILVMEDADAFLKSREGGNTMMHKFLNVSDGLISAVGKKMIFSTNLPNISDIDEALLRTGRCYDTVQFRALGREEARAVLTEVGSERELPDGKEFTLAQIFSVQPVASVTPKRSMGFAP